MQRPLPQEASPTIENRLGSTPPGKFFRSHSAFNFSANFPLTKNNFFHSKSYANQQKRRKDSEEVTQRVHYSANLNFKLWTFFHYLEFSFLLIFIWLCFRIWFWWFQFHISLVTKEKKIANLRKKLRIVSRHKKVIKLSFVIKRNWKVDNIKAAE